MTQPITRPSALLPGSLTVEAGRIREGPPPSPDPGAANGPSVQPFPSQRVIPPPPLSRDERDR